jgi:hypothetical protein
MLVYYFVSFIVSNRYLLFWVLNGHNSVTVQNRTHVYMNFFHHKDLRNHLLQLWHKVVKHPVYYIIHDTYFGSLLPDIVVVPFSCYIYIHFFYIYAVAVCTCLQLTLVIFNTGCTKEMLPLIRRVLLKFKSTEGPVHSLPLWMSFGFLEGNL